MVRRSGYADGEPCWLDTVAPDPEATQRFYGALFGWTFQNMGPEYGNYTFCLKNGERVAAMMPPQPSMTAPPMWSVYLATGNVDDTVRRVEKADGTVIIGPADVPGQGRFAYAADPTGAPFGLWQPGGLIGAALTDEPGALCWAEVQTRDGAAADRFYRALFDYRQERMGDERVLDFTAWRVADGRTVCGRLQMGPDFPDSVPAQWMPYFAVQDTDAVTEAAQSLGAHVPMGPWDSGYGRMAVISDPAGAAFSIITPRERT